ncbi:MAG: ECF transporter S component [Firmicutes bacterium]|nr:ECF transporter S component [Bacillota bacterium]
MGRTGYDDRQLTARKKRTFTAGLLILIAMPLTLIAGSFLMDSANYMLISLLVIIYTMIPFFMIFEKRRPKAREIVLIAMMTAITVACHMFFNMTISVIEIGTAMVIIAGIAMGPEAGFLVGALARFVCNFFLSQGPWTPWQMFTWGLLGFIAGLTFSISQDGKKSSTFHMIMGPVICVFAAVALAYVTYLIILGNDTTFFGWRIYVFGAAGLLAGLILQKKRMPADRATLTLFTFLTTVIIYGGILNAASLFTMSGMPGTEISWNTLRLMYVSGLPYDLLHAGTAAACMLLMGRPMIDKIERIKIKYGIYR